MKRKTPNTKLSKKKKFKNPLSVTCFLDIEGEVVVKWEQPATRHNNLQTSGEFVIRTFSTQCWAGEDICS